MNWYLQSGNESDVLISSRVRLTRNIDGINFVTKASKEDLKKVYDKMEEITPVLGYGLKFKPLKDISTLERKILVEKNIIPFEFAKGKNLYEAIIINEDENICIIVNDVDHIKIEVMSSGLELENLMNLAVEIDQKIEDLVPYSYSEKYGYLTSLPINVGTGMKSSVFVHLPALVMTGNLRKVLNIVNNLGMNFRGIYGQEGKIEGDIYCISNNQTLGVTEKEIIKNLNVMSQKVIQQERVARKYLCKNELELKDRIYRDYGILSNCIKIDYFETLDLLSNIKMGVDLGIMDELNDTQIQKIYLYTKPNHILQRVGNERCTSEKDEEVERAKIIKEIIIDSGK